MTRSLGMLFLTFFFWPLWATGDEKLPSIPEFPATENTKALVRAHAHNDYLHERPLLDALHNGFCSVEADVFLVDGRLLVGHERAELRTQRTLETLYLDPLLIRVRENGNEVFAGCTVFTLLVDIKSDGKETYMALNSVLARYREMLSVVRQEDFEINAVTVIVSGERAWERIVADSPRFAGVDGRLSDVSSDRPSHLMPLISDSWERVFSWSGEGPMPDAQRATLRQIVYDAHEKGRRVRFWATPDRPSPERTAIWSELLAAGVDLIGTDDLDGLRAFLLSAESLSCQR